MASIGSKSETDEVVKTSSKKVETELLFRENEDVTRNLKSNGLPYCKICGSGFRTNLNGEKICPNQKKDCPLLQL